MAKIEITKTELVWPGKYNEDGTLKEVPRVNLPFQIIETVNESRATRISKESSPSLFDTYEGKEGDTFEEGWRNKLIWGDNLLVMGSLLEKFAGKIDLIYIDPPFATGADFSFTAQIGDGDDEVYKEQSVIEEKAYRDTWGKGNESFINMIHCRLKIIYELLSDNGSLYVHCDWRMNSTIRFLLDEIFGAGNIVNQIAWYYKRWNTESNMFSRNWDNILYYAKDVKKKTFNNLFIPKSEKSSGNGKAWVSIIGEDGIRRSVLTNEVSKGVPMPDMWEISMINPVALERIGYPTQKPEALLERIIKASSSEGDLVADFFCGSGTTLAVAEKLGRRWIGCDLGRWAIHTTRKRLLGIENCRPFEVLNLGKYERQYWQGVTFGREKNSPTSERMLYEYLAFVLKLYGAQPLPGMEHIHGKRGRALVHIGAVDAPVTIAEINASINECKRLAQSELHVLGWEWEMGLNDLMADAAKKQDVKLILYQIPREVMETQAVEKGDIQFYELAYLQFDTKQNKERKIQIELTNFVIPNYDLIPQEVRDKVVKWSDFIDYWAVDWDFRNDTFMQSWVTYRTKKDRTLALKSDVHTYENPGKYRILVKVIDIFGNDTSLVRDLEV